MDPLTIGLLLAGATLVSSVVTGFFNRGNVRETNQTNQQSVESTNQANRLLAEQQHNWNVQDWNMQNAYDSPQAQMQRFKDAGLNPSLIYGQMSQSPSVNSVDMPEMQSNKAIPFLAENPMSNIDPASLANVELAKSEAELNRANADSIRQKLPEELNNLRKQSEELQAQIESLNQSVAESARRIQSMDVDDQFNLAQKARIEFQSSLDDKRFNLDSLRLEMDKLNSSSQRRLNSAQINNLESITRLNNREYRELLATWKYRLLGFDLQNQKLQSAIGLDNSQISYYENLAEKAGLEISAGRVEDYFNSDAYDDLTGKNGWYNYYKTKMNMKLARDLKSFGDTGKLLFRVGK